MSFILVLCKHFWYVFLIKMTLVLTVVQNAVFSLIWTAVIFKRNFLLTTDYCILTSYTNPLANNIELLIINMSFYVSNEEQMVLFSM